MEPIDTLVLSRNDVARLLEIDECMAAVEQAFKLYGEGKMSPPKILGMHAANGGFHIKVGLSGDNTPYFVAKLNANFPDNFHLYGLPTIQGIIAVFDGVNGRLLAITDSIEITIIRTGAATGIAAKYLSLPDSR